MELKFDNEIDAILRGMAKQANFANSPTEHLDADEISMFAENVLSGDARIRAMSHLADCNRCRIILTNVIKLNSEAESEIVHAVSAPSVETKQISWFEKMFKLPTLAYTFGALTIVFAGLIGVSLLHNNQNNELAQATKDEVVQKNTTSDHSFEENNSPLQSSDSNNSAVANTVVNSPANTLMPATNSTANVPISTANASAPVTNSSMIAEKNTASNSNVANATAMKSTDSQIIKRVEERINQPAAEPLKKEADIDKKDVGFSKMQAPKPSITPNEPIRTQDSVAVAENKASDEEVETTRGRAIPKVARKQKAEAPNAPSSITSSQNEANSRSVGGKTFLIVNGIWTDSAFTGGSTKTIKRNSNDYKKLDAGLQNIGNSLNGTLIVVWNGKNYKIQ